MKTEEQILDKLTELVDKINATADAAKQSPGGKATAQQELTIACTLHASAALFWAIDCEEEFAKMLATIREHAKNMEASK